MQALQISDVKGCMNHMLLKDTFDHFSLVEATITTKASFVIDGALVDGYYDESELAAFGGNVPKFMPYGEARNICLDVIKGKKTPGYFKFVFSAPRDIIAQLIAVNDISIDIDDVASLSLNIRYQNELLYATTGSSLKVFTPDKSLDNAWDEYIEKFLIASDISYEKM